MVERSMRFCPDYATHREIVFQVRVSVPMETGLVPVLPLGQGHLVPTSTPAPFIGFLSRGYRITGVCLPSFPIQRFDSSFYPKKFQDLNKFYTRRIHTKLSRTFFTKVFFHSSVTLSRKQCRSNFS